MELFDETRQLLPAIAQDHESGQVLMMAWMNADAFRETVDSGYATYYSRSRQKLWRKGEESGHRQRVISLHVDCDADTILLKVEQTGAACHAGYRTCFYRSWSNGEWIIDQPLLVRPEDVYR